MATQTKNCADAPPVPAKAQRQPLVVADRNLRVYLECAPEGVRLYPLKTWVPAEALSHSPDHNPLTKAVRQFIADRQATPQGSAAQRPMLFFMVRPDSGITYERARDALRSLGIPVFYRLVERPEDVSALLAGG